MKETEQGEMSGHFPGGGQSWRVLQGDNWWGSHCCLGSTNRDLRNHLWQAIQSGPFLRLQNKVVSPSCFQMDAWQSIVIESTGSGITQNWHQIQVQVQPLLELLWNSYLLSVSLYLHLRCNNSNYLTKICEVDELIQIRQFAQRLANRKHTTNAGYWHYHYYVSWDTAPADTVPLFGREGGGSRWDSWPRNLFRLYSKEVNLRRSCI